MQTWTAKVRDVYASLEELEAYDAIYSIARRCGYDTAADLWEANPMIQGSVNPADFGIAKKPQTKKESMYPPPDDRTKKPAGKIPDEIKKMLADLKGKMPDVHIVSDDENMGAAEILPLMAMLLNESRMEIREYHTKFRATVRAWDEFGKRVAAYLNSAKDAAALDDLRDALATFGKPEDGDYMAVCKKCGVIWKGQRAVAGPCWMCGKNDDVLRHKLD